VHSPAGWTPRRGSTFVGAVHHHITPTLSEGRGKLLGSRREESGKQAGGTGSHQGEGGLRQRDEREATTEGSRGEEAFSKHATAGLVNTEHQTSAKLILTRDEKPVRDFIAGVSIPQRASQAFELIGVPRPVMAICPRVSIPQRASQAFERYPL
jgi:hypothetical protein